MRFQGLVVTDPGLDRVMLDRCGRVGGEGPPTHQLIKVPPKAGDHLGP